MMIGGMPPHRGAGTFIRPIPKDGVIPDRFEKVDCAPLQELLREKKRHVDLFVLDVEGAELPVLDTIDWDTLTFSALEIETDKVKNRTALDHDMARRGYHRLYSIEADTIYVPDTSKFANPTRAWRPPGSWFKLAG
jgi:hypothetical protein